MVECDDSYIRNVKKSIARRKSIYLKEVEKKRLRGALMSKIDEKEILDCEIENLEVKLEELEKEKEK